MFPLEDVLLGQVNNRVFLHSVLPKVPCRVQGGPGVVPGPPGLDLVEGRAEGTHGGLGGKGGEGISIWINAGLAFERYYVSFWLS